MRAILISLALLCLTSCGHTERFVIDNGVCYKHARYWFIISLESDINRVSPEKCQP